MEKMMNIATAITPPMRAESLCTALVSGSLSSVFSKRSDEECTVVTAFTSESIIEPQLDSVKIPWMVTGAVVAWHRAAFSGAMCLYWTEARQPTKPRVFALATSESNPRFSVTSPKVRDLTALNSTSEEKL